jgi:hypothetical protein
VRRCRDARSARPDEHCENSSADPHEKRAKTRNLWQRPECSVLILDLERPDRYPEVRGRARLTSDPDYAFAPKLGAKYELDLSGIDSPGDQRVVVTIEPEKVYAVDMSR